MKKGWKKQWDYAVYKGEDCIAIGTKEEVAKILGVKPKTIDFYRTKTYRKQCEERNNTWKDGFIEVIRIEEDEE